MVGIVLLGIFVLLLAFGAPIAVCKQQYKDTK